MLELIFALIAGSGALSMGAYGLVSWHRNGVQEKKFSVVPGLEAPEPPRHIGGTFTQIAIEAPKRDIPKDIRDEIDQTSDWWDKQYHLELKRAGAKVIARHVTKEGEDRVALAGCDCANCVEVMKLAPGKKSRHKELKEKLDSFELPW